MSLHKQILIIEELSELNNLLEDVWIRLFNVEDIEDKWNLRIERLQNEVRQAMKNHQQQIIESEKLRG